MLVQLLKALFSGELMLRYNLAALRSQWKHVKRSRQQKEAYKIGIRFWKHAWGRFVAKDVRAYIEAKQRKRAIQGAWALLRFCPSYLPLIMSDKPLLQKIRDCIKRAVSKTTLRRFMIERRARK